jgi:parallel beta-helix repeat protein
MKKYVNLLLSVAVLSAIFLSGFLPFSRAKANASSTVNPGDSIQQAINNAGNGDVINITSGTYHESRIIVNKTVTLLGINAETTVVDGDETTGAIFAVHADGVKIRNLTVQNTSDSGGIGISITNYGNLEVSDCIIGQCWYGMDFTNATNSVVARSTVKDNYVYGIHLHDNSSYNRFFGSTIENNKVGVSVDLYCQKNLFYYNDLLNNANHTQGFGRSATDWNATYPSGGNFWSDYVGLDLNHGPYQDVNGSDGIGDTNYTLITDATDSYPLMAPTHYFYSGKWNQQEYYVAIGTSSNVSDYGFFADGPQPFVSFTLTDSNTNSCRVTILRQMLFVSPPAAWTVEANQTVLSDVLILEDADFTYFYFNFTEASNVTIKAIGTGAVPEFSQLVLPIMLTTSMIPVLLKKRKR